MIGSELSTDFSMDALVSNGAPAEDEKIDRLTLPFIPEPQSFEVLEGDTVVAQMYGFDVDGVPLTWSISGGPDGDLFSVDEMTGLLTFNSPPDFESPADEGADNDYFLNVQYTNGVVDTEYTVLVAVLNTFETFPSPLDDTRAMSRGSADRSFDVLANDIGPNGEPVFLVDVAPIDPAIGNVSVNADQTIRFDPDPGFWGDVAIDYVVINEEGASDLATLTVTVLENFAPFIAEPVSFLAFGGETFVGNLAGFDLDGDGVTWFIAGGPDAALFSVDPSTGQLSSNSPLDFNAPLDVGADNDYNLTVRLSDEFGYTEQPILVSVGCDHCGPPPRTVEFDPRFRSDDGPFHFFVTDDTDGDQITFTARGWSGNPLEYRLFGEDADLFDLDPVSGELSLPQTLPGITGSFDTDGVYELTILVRDGDVAEDFLEVVLPMLTAA